MAHVKYSARRAFCQGRRVRFGAPTRVAARNWHYQLHLQLRKNQIPSDDEEAPLPAADWQDLEPSLQEGSSLPVEAVVKFWNEGCPLSAPSPVVTLLENS